MVLQTHLVEIDALIRLLDAGIGQMLIAIAKIVLTLVTKAHTYANMITKLEAAAELALRADRRTG